MSGRQVSQENRKRPKSRAVSKNSNFEVRNSNDQMTETTTSPELLAQKG